VSVLIQLRRYNNNKKTHKYKRFKILKPFFSIYSGFGFYDLYEQFISASSVL